MKMLNFSREFLTPPQKEVFAKKINPCLEMPASLACLCLLYLSMFTPTQLFAYDVVPPHVGTRGQLTRFAYLSICRFIFLILGGGGVLILDVF